jgi:hypothetical protein
VVGSAFDRAAGSLVAAVGAAQLLSPGQQVVGGGGEGVRRPAVVGSGDQQQFGVGGCGVFGQPAQLVGFEVVGVVDDDEAADR